MEFWYEITPSPYTVNLKYNSIYIIVSASDYVHTF